MDLGLEGKVAIVTGGSKGIGLATVREFLREGARVVTCARDGLHLERQVAALREETGGEVIGVVADVTDPAAIEELVGRAVSAFGGIDVLVNNAGRAYPGGFEQLADEHWRADLDVKLFSMIRCSRAVLPHMRARGGGAIVNVNAVFGKQVDPAFFATSTNRAACIAFTKTLARELAPQGIRVNGVNIGFVESAQWGAIRSARSPELSQEEFYAEWARRWQIPLGRYGRGEEAAAAIAFLASERAGYIVGASLDVDGGLARYL